MECSPATVCLGAIVGVTNCAATPISHGVGDQTIQFVDRLTAGFDRGEGASHIVAVWCFKHATFKASVGAALLLFAKSGVRRRHGNRDVDRVTCTRDV